MSIFHKYFSSFEAENCVSNSSVKWRKLKTNISLALWLKHVTSVGDIVTGFQCPALKQALSYIRQEDPFSTKWPPFNGWVIDRAWAGISLTDTTSTQHCFRVGPPSATKGPKLKQNWVIVFAGWLDFPGCCVTTASRPTMRQRHTTPGEW